MRLTGTDRSTLRRIICDAIEWRAGVADAWAHGTPERQQAIDAMARYEALHVKLMGEPSYYAQQLAAEKNATYVSIFDLNRRT